MQNTQWQHFWSGVIAPCSGGDLCRRRRRTAAGRPSAISPPLPANPVIAAPLQELKIFKQRTLAPSQLEVQRQLAAEKVDVGRVSQPHAAWACES